MLTSSRTYTNLFGMLGGRRFVWLSVVVLLPLVLVSFFGLSLIEFRPGRQENVTQGEVSGAADVNIEAQGIGVALDFGDGRVVSFESKVEKQTAYEALIDLVEQEGLEYEVEQYNFGVFVKSIDGYESTEERSWIYFVNGKSGAVAADQMEVSAGDKVEWKYVEPGF